MTDRKIGLKPIGAGLGIASVGIAAAALIGYGMTGTSSADTTFKQDPATITATEGTNTVTATVTTPTTPPPTLTTLESPSSAPSLPPAPPAP
ncbi:hypothetical protein F0Q45_20710 [Mycobacterium simiae]|uniref:Uncharacterized protein n=1 Tax=Mycobacterium simiae TaxID=1784 RepID=A0A5B1BIE1_MYCSI|nr:hypothetical protein F0Q45_20710 [Mycobacterium simiae]